jgi:hypothetical protein
MAHQTSKLRASITRIGPGPEVKEEEEPTTEEEETQEDPE